MISKISSMCQRVCVFTPVYFCISEEESFDFLKKTACRDRVAEVVADGAGERERERERERRIRR